MRKLIIVILISFVVAQLGFMLVERGVKKFNCFSYDRLHEIIQGTNNYDVLYLGSSRTQCHINPCIVDSITHFNSFNAGKAGANSLEAKMLLEAYLSSHKPPKYVFYNIDALSVNTVSVVPNASMYLFFLDNERIAQNLKNTFDRIYLLKALPFTRLFYFDDYFRNIALQGYFSKNELLTTVNYCRGHASNTGDTVAVVEMAKRTITSVKPDLGEIQRMISVCKTNHIQLIFHSTPVIFKDGIPTSSQHVPEIDALAIAEQIPFIRFDTSKAFSKKDFIDFGHLNKTGSEKYSRLFAYYLKQLKMSNPKP